MSVEQIAIVLHHSKARGTAGYVLIGIANHEGDGGAYPAVATLAKYANVDERTVQRAIQSLADAGEISVETRFETDETGRRMQRSNRYRVLVRCPDDCDRSPQHRTDDHSSRGDSHSLGGDSSVTGGGDTGVTRGVTLASPKPSLNHPSEPSSSPASPVTTERTRAKQNVSDRKEQPPSGRSTSPPCPRHADQLAARCPRCSSEAAQQPPDALNDARATLRTRRQARKPPRGAHALPAAP